ncbi:MAG: BNR repeat-containing protein [Chloroflexota bacterium]
MTHQTTNHTNQPIELVLDIDLVWSGHPVNFCLLTTKYQQYVAYYDQYRQMTVAQRAIGDQAWDFYKVPSAQDSPPGYRAADSSTILGWDSHNYVSMAMDASGYIHLSGNMHCNGLTYFRSTYPYDITTLAQVFAMTGENEAECTYPQFLFNKEGTLIFHYRDGSSGNGSEIYNIYDTDIKTWRRLLDTPLTDGQGLMNAYMHEPLLGPDGLFHMSWVWRDTPDCSTNHDLSYACSHDFIHWKTAAGVPITLPMMLHTNGLIVDPVPAQGGIINGTGKIGFDTQQRPILVYHKFDEQGITQAYAARFEAGNWAIYQLSDWTYRWYFEGGGSIQNDVYLGAVERNAEGALTVWYNHKEEGMGIWTLNEETLQPVTTTPIDSLWPKQLTQVEADFPNMQVNFLADSATKYAGEETGYFLRWETLVRNRDRPRTGSLPEPSMLRLYKLV